MNTPIQELIEQVQQWMLDDKHVQDNPSDYEEYMVHYANQMIEVKSKFIDMCKSLLDKEKEQILNAYTSNSMIRTNFKAEQYYNETFNTKETCTCKSAQFTREVTEDFEPMCGRCGRPI